MRLRVRTYSVAILAFASACGGSTLPSGAAGADASANRDVTDVSDASFVEPPSCAPGGPGMTNCGATKESCCTSPEVTVGMDVTNFRLDKYDVTVGRFRQFVEAWKAGYSPPAGSGKHTNLHNGLGLQNSGSDAGVAYETGWLASDDANVGPTDTALASCYPYVPGQPSLPTTSTWTDSPGTDELLPINCVNWWEAYAFCIWDGGFLPTDVEFGYAITGGAENREYPWGSTSPGHDSEYAVYGCYYNGDGPADCSSVQTNLPPVGTAVRGVGRWGQLDLVGSVQEWELDYAGVPLISPCSDCAYLSATDTVQTDAGVMAQRLVRGTSWGDFTVDISSVAIPPSRTHVVGFRCARLP